MTLRYKAMLVGLFLVVPSMASASFGQQPSPKFFSECPALVEYEVGIKVLHLASNETVRIVDKRTGDPLLCVPKPDSNGEPTTIGRNRPYVYTVHFSDGATVEAKQDEIKPLAKGSEQ